MIGKEEIKGVITTQELKGELGKTIEIIPPKTQEKSCIPTTQAQEITPDETYTGLSKVNVGAIPEEYVIPSGTEEITTNGTYNIKTKEYVNVNTSGIDPAEYFYNSFENAGSGGQYNPLWAKLVKDIPSPIDASDLSSLSYVFYLYSGKIPKIENMENIHYFNSMFQRNMNEEIEISDWEFNNNWVDMSNGFAMCLCKKISLPCLGQFNFMGMVSNFTYMFYASYSLKEVNLPNLTIPIPSGWSTNGTCDISRMFQYCYAMEKIDMSSFDFTATTYYTDTFGADANSGIPDNCLILVKDQTQKDWVESHFSRLTNVQIKEV